MKSAGFGVGNGQTGEGEIDGANMTRVGVLVVVVIKPDVETLGIRACEFEFHRYLKIFATFKFDVVYACVNFDILGAPDQHAILNDTCADIMSPASVEVAA